MDLIAPLIPNAQENKGPELFLQSAQMGFAAAARFAEMKRSSEMEMARLAEHERVAQDAHELKKREMDLEAGYRDRQMALNEELLPYRKMELEASANWKRATFGQRAMQNAKRTATIQDFQERLVAYNLDDPNPKDPVAYYANANRLQDEFKYANVPEITHGLKEVKRTTESHSIRLRNRVLDEATGEYKLSGESKEVPIGKLAMQLQDPKTFESTMDVLETNGMIKWEQSNPDDPKSPEVRKIDKQVLDLIDKGKKIDFTRGKSRTLPAEEEEEPLSLPTEPTPQVDDINLFEPTETAAAIKQAKAAIAKGAPMAAVAQRLKEMSIDPGLLFDAA